MHKQRKSIVVVQTILPHYRSSYFNRIVESPDWDVKVLSGSSDEIPSFLLKMGKIFDNLKNKRFRVGGHTFIFQLGLFRYLRTFRPEHIVFSGPDLHIVSTLIAFVYFKLFTNIKLHWWTHGLTKNGQITRTIQQLFMRFSDSVLTYEVAGKETIIKSLNWPSSKISVLKNGISEQDYGFLTFDEPTLTGGNKPKERAINLLFAGRLTPQKRCDLLIESLAVLKSKNVDFFAHIVGDGKMLVQCKMVARELGISDQVKFYGSVYGEELKDIFLTSDLFILPGKIGLSVVHALSYGLPVLSTDKDIHSPEVAIIQDGLNGSFFSGYSSTSLASKIIEWKEKLATHQKEIKQNAIASVHEAGYTPEKMAIAFFKHFESFE